MIISRTPFRLSLFGGGSDLRDYYRHRPGTVVTLAINRHMYVTVNARFDRSIRASYTQTEIVDHVDDLHHDLIREALKMVGITNGVEVTTIADIPAGIGLGSSSSLTVGLLNALYAFRGQQRSAEELARRACEIEIDILKHPIGKQDQYIAAYGGFHRFRFLGDETVDSMPVICSPATRSRLLGQLLLFFTGVSRDAGSVLGEARQRLQRRADAPHPLDGMVGQAERFFSAVTSNRIALLGPLLHETWTLKRQMASNVSTPDIDRWYAAARRAGAVGGKIAGAGGGGCLLLAAPRNRQPRVRRALARLGLREIAFGFDPFGSRIIYVGQ